MSFRMACQCKIADSVPNIYDLSKTELQDHLCLQTLLSSNLPYCYNFSVVYKSVHIFKVAQVSNYCISYPIEYFTVLLRKFNCKKVGKIVRKWYISAILSTLQSFSLS